MRRLDEIAAREVGMVEHEPPLRRHALADGDALARHQPRARRPRVHGVGVITVVITFSISSHGRDMNATCANGSGASRTSNGAPIAPAPIATAREIAMVEHRALRHAGRAARPDDRDRVVGLGAREIDGRIVGVRGAHRVEIGVADHDPRLRAVEDARDLGRARAAC